MKLLNNILPIANKLKELGANNFSLYQYITGTSIVNKNSVQLIRLLSGVDSISIPTKFAIINPYIVDNKCKDIKVHYFKFDAIESKETKLIDGLYYEIINIKAFEFAITDWESYSQHVLYYKYLKPRPLAIYHSLDNIVTKEILEKLNLINPSSVIDQKEIISASENYANVIIENSKNFGRKSA